MIFLQLLANHIVKGEVRSSELDNDMVGPTIANTRIRANVYKTEDDNWKEVKVRTTRVRMTVKGNLIHFILSAGHNCQRRSCSPN